MFTGIITEIGTISEMRSASPARLSVECPESAPDISYGDSVSVSGICLTAVETRENGFSAAISDETVARSSLLESSIGDRVNIELAMQAGGRFGGHIVQGHVDGLGTIRSRRQVKTGWLFEISHPEDIDRYIVEKGSICVDGISLTVASVSSGSFSIAVIPSTFTDTTLQYLKPGDAVHLEVDILAKYVEKMLGVRSGSSKISEDFLRRHGFWEPE